MSQSHEGQFWRRLAITAAVLAAYRLGTSLPLPGLDSEKVWQLARLGSPSIERISILSLGIMPLLNALLLVEIVKLLAPGVRRWASASLRNADRLSLIVAGLALALALLQGAGLAAALEDVSGLVAEPGTTFRIACLATLMAGAAASIAFVTVIDRAGLGSGLWLLFLVPGVADAPRTLAGLATLTASGIYGAGPIILGFGLAALAIAVIVGIILAARAAPATTASCVWTPFVANAFATLPLLALASLSTFSADAAAKLVAPGHLAWSLAFAACVVLAVWLYTRSYAAIGEASPVPSAPVAAALAAILVAGPIFERQFGLVLPLGSAQLIIAATVCTTLLIAWGRAPSKEGREDAALDPNA